MTTYRTYGPVSEGVALQAQMQRDALRQQWNNRLVDLFGSVVGEVKGYAWKSQQAAQERKQQDRYYELQKGQYDNAQESRDFANAQKLAALRLEAPDLADIVAKTAVGQRLMSKYGWDQPGADTTQQVDRFKNPATGRLFKLDGDANVPPPQLPTSPFQPQVGTTGNRELTFEPLEMGGAETGGGPNVMFDPSGALAGGGRKLSFYPEFSDSAAPIAQTADPSGKEMTFGAGEATEYPSLEQVRVPMQVPGPSPWEKMGAKGRARQAGEPLAALAAGGEKLAQERRLAGTPITVENMETLVQGLITANPEQEQVLRDAAERWKKALPQSESDQLRISLAKIGIQSGNGKDIIGAIKARMQAENQMASKALTMAQTAAQSGDSTMRDGYLGSSSAHQENFRKLSVMLAQVQDKLGLDPKAFLAGETPTAPLSRDAVATPPASPPAAPTTPPAPTGGKGKGKGGKGKSGASKPLAGASKTLTFDPMDMQTGTTVPAGIKPPDYGVTEGQLGERQNLVRRITSPTARGGILPGSAEWNDAAARLWPDPKDKASAERFRAAGAHLSAAIGDLAIDPENELHMEALQAARAELAPLGLEVPMGQIAVQVERSAPPDFELGKARDSLAQLAKQPQTGKAEDDAERLLRNAAGKALGVQLTKAQLVTLSQVKQLLKAGVISDPIDPTPGAAVSFERLPKRVKVQIWQGIRTGQLGAF